MDQDPKSSTYPNSGLDSYDYQPPSTSTPKRLWIFFFFSLCMLIAGIVMLGIGIHKSNEDHTHVEYKIPSGESYCGNKCGAENANNFVEIQVDSTTTGPPFKGKSDYISQMTVILAMKNLQYTSQKSNDSKDKFTFTTSYWAPYGEYITSINGQNATAGRYWALYVNGAMNECGIDTTILNSGDVIQWRQDSTNSSAMKLGRHPWAHVYL